MKQVFFSDVDGTLLAHRQKMPNTVRDTAIEYQRRGGQLVLCTGRSEKSLRPVVETLAITLPCIVCCGAGIYDFQAAQYLWRARFPIGIHERLRGVLDEYPSIAVQAFTTDDIYTLSMNRQLAERGILLEQEDGIRTAHEIQGELLKLLLVCEDVDLLHRCRSTYFSGDDYTVEAASTHFTEVTPVGVDKGVAAKRFLQMLKLEDALICAAGDGRTDLPLLQEANLRFAPKNAKPELQAICDYVVPAAEEGGMATAFSIAAERM